jgi:hypothetical protein
VRYVGPLLGPSIHLSPFCANESFDLSRGQEGLQAFSDVLYCRLQNPHLALYIEMVLETSELAAEIRKRIPKFTCEYEPDFGRRLLIRGLAPSTTAFLSFTLPSIGAILFVNRTLDVGLGTLTERS